MPSIGKSPIMLGISRTLPYNRGKGETMIRRYLKQTGILVLCTLLLSGCGEKKPLPEVPGEVSAEAEIPALSEKTEHIGENRGEQETTTGTNLTLTQETTPETSPAAEQETTPETFPAAEQETTSEPTPSPLPEMTLVMVGDVLLHTPLAQSGETPDGGYDFTALFTNVKEEIEEADLALVNQEVIIGGSELGISGYPAFNAPYELGDALADSGFDVILHGTNHALDKGKRGLLNCLAFWKENYPEKAVLGIHDSAEDGEEIYVYEQDGIRIAVLNYTYGTNGIPLPEDMPYGVDMLEEDRVIRDLQRAEEMADFTVVCPHWGTEYTLSETKTQKRWAELFAENGADLVIGTHPHVIEPVAWVEDTLVYYSLGNFANWTSGTGEGVANRMVGGMAKVTIGMEEDGEVGIIDWGVEPLVCHLEQGFGGVTVYPLEEYTEELAEKNEIVKQDGNFSLDYCLELVESVFGETAERTD